MISSNSKLFEAFALFSKITPGALFQSERVNFSSERNDDEKDQFNKKQQKKQKYNQSNTGSENSRNHESGVNSNRKSLESKQNTDTKKAFEIDWLNELTSIKNDQNKYYEYEENTEKHSWENYPKPFIRK
jgi:hypothetical protein